MTTVVYRDGIMASDSRITEGDMICPHKEPKICKLPDDTLFGWCGSQSTAMQMLVYMLTEDDGDCPTWRDETLVVHVQSERKIRCYEGHAGVWLPIRNPFLVAIGSGAPYAYGAMSAGASAVEAVKIAMKFDPASGGPVRSLKLQEKEKKCKTKKSA